MTSIDWNAKEVHLDGGKEKVSYSTLILAPGGTPRRLPIEGVDLGNVFTLRGIDDAKNIDAGASLLPQALCSLTVLDANSMYMQRLRRANASS